LKIFAAAAVLLVVAGVGGYFLWERSRAGTGPQSVPAPAPTAAAPSPAAPAAAPTAAAEAPTPAPPEPTAPPAQDPDAPVTVTFESNSNALLTVDGKSFRGLPAPVRVSLKPGKHVAVFEVPNYQKKTESFEVPPGGPAPGVRVNFPPWGILDVSSDPPGAEVRVDGKAVGTTPLKKPVPVGTHALEVSLPGYETAAESRDVAELESTRAFFRLKKGS
jgi:hypothetical protein